MVPAKRARFPNQVLSVGDAKQAEHCGDPGWDSFCTSLGLATFWRLGPRMIANSQNRSHNEPSMPFLLHHRNCLGNDPGSTDTNPRDEGRGHSRPDLPDATVGPFPGELLKGIPPLVDIMHLLTWRITLGHRTLHPTVYSPGARKPL